MLFFVAKGDGSGAHTFSKTMEEHNAAIQELIKARKAQAEQAEQAKPPAE